MRWVRRVGIVLHLVIVAMLAFWIADRGLPVVQMENRIVARVVPGGMAQLHTQVVRHRLCATRVERDVIDGSGIRHSLKDEDWASAPGPLGVEDYTTFIPIPANAHPGASSVRFILSWSCNPIQVAWPIVDRFEVPFVIER